MRKPTMAMDWDRSLLVFALVASFAWRLERTERDELERGMEKNNL